MIPRPGCHGGVVTQPGDGGDHAAVRITRACVQGAGCEVIQARLLAGLSQGVG